MTAAPHTTTVHALGRCLCAHPQHDGRLLVVLSMLASLLGLPPRVLVTRLEAQGIHGEWFERALDGKRLQGIDANLLARVESTTQTRTKVA